MTELATRAQAFGLIADGVAAGLSAPWRLYLARGCRYLSLNVGDRAEWNSWRTHLGCPELSVRVYDAGGEIRRASVAEVVLDGCRISVELVEEVSTEDLDRLLVTDPTALDPTAPDPTTVEPEET
ncbi:hypothetical protein [Plantactinospora endophytica]|uniref:Uncharacterized protein n=1 Tax=Plantactinospora endophytica TaxID=673535 RepID=A0ABQ4DTI6_9ACTN|nr:hypothetical protein [Plantactinospora endophytica]GIG85752.1 hypothetical protein Pen02_06880 [Plantactinospora endophytica]